MSVEAQLTAAPAKEEPEREIDDDESDRGLRDLMKPLRKKAVEQEHRKPEGKQRHRVAEAPGKPELPGTASRALASARNERRDGSEVIRVGRMAQSEKNGDSENDPDRSAVGGCGDFLVEAEHPITSSLTARV
jgi:hypothetical protein